MSKKDSTKEIILAVAYCRKSTIEENTEKSIADQIARISKLQPPDENIEYKIVRWYTKDKGIPGWARGAARPDYFKLVNELKETKAKAILVDDADRFSRADIGETISDVQKLRELGIRYIHCCNQGVKDLNGGMDVWIRIACEAMSSHEHCTKLSRRIAYTRKDAAVQGKRSGGSAPYGLKNEYIGEGDDKKFTGKLIHGDPQNVKTVQWVFDQFVKANSMTWIRNQLNLKGIKTRLGCDWSTQGIKELLQQKAYRGDFVFNEYQSGQFYIIDDKKEVVSVSQYSDNKNDIRKSSDGGIFITKNVYKPIIEPKLFEAAQKRLETFYTKKNRPRTGGFPLSGGILICGHCGAPMTGCNHTGRNKRVYRCSTNNKFGKRKCNTYKVDESEILPFIIKILGDEIDNIIKFQPHCPINMIEPENDRDNRRVELEKEISNLQSKINIAVENIMEVQDKETRKDMDKKITEHRANLAKLQLERNALDDESDGDGWNLENLKKIEDWWADFKTQAVHVPLDPIKYQDSAAYHEAWNDGTPFGTLCNAQFVNKALHDLGCQVELRWKTETSTTSTGKPRNGYTLDKGRLTLGKRNEDVTFCKVPQTAGRFI